MSRINRIRIMNLNYNGNTIRIDDETFDLNGESTLLSLRNGGGKTVLVQMVISLFVNKSYRDFEDRPFKSYFTTNRPTFIMTEWSLDYGRGYFLTGMMVRKCQNLDDNNNEELEMINFTGFYSSACEYDLDNLPIVDDSSGNKVLKGFGTCKKEFEQLKKNKNSDFSYYDMSQPHARRMYFSRLKEYQINHKEWESVIKKVNLKESGLSELFANAKDEKGLVEKWMLDAVENKLNQENNRVKEFQTLGFKMIQQYRSNQSKIRRKEVIEQYFEDSELIDGQIVLYEQEEQNLQYQKSSIAMFRKNVNSMTEELSVKLEEKKKEIDELENQINETEHEKISYHIYCLDDQKTELTEKRIESELRITQSAHAKEIAERELCRFQCAGLFEELQDFGKRVSELQEKIDILLLEQRDSEEERRELGSLLYQYYSNRILKCEADILENEKEISQTEQDKAAKRDENVKELKNSNKIFGKLGALEASILKYDEVENRYNKQFFADLSRNILGEYEEGIPELNKRKIQDELVDTSALITRISEKSVKLKEEERNLLSESEQLKISAVCNSNDLQVLKEKLEKLLEEKSRRSIIMQYIDADENEIDNKVILLERLERKLNELENTQDEYKNKLAGLKREYHNLKQGKVVELPEHIIGFLEEQNIDIVYGMEWLRKNNRDVLENQKLISKNPFLPFCLIMSNGDIEKLKKAEKEIYTNFPIPIIVRENLEKVIAKDGESLICFGEVHFFVMFNRHLLEPKELQKLIESKQHQIDGWQEKIEIKAAEMKEYRSYYAEIESQFFTTKMLKETEEKIKKEEEEQEKIQQAQLVCKKAQKQNILNQEENIKSEKEAIRRKDFLKRQSEEYQSLLESYGAYLADRKEQQRYLRKQKETAEKIEVIGNVLQEIEEKLFSLNEEKRGLGREVSKYKESLSAFMTYKDEVKNDLSDDFNVTRAETRYTAITEGIAAPLNDLKSSLEKERKRYDKKCRELDKRNKYNFLQEEYQSIQFTDERIEHLEENIVKAEREVNFAMEENNKLEKNITRLETLLEETKKRLFERFGSDRLIERERIVNIDFDARLKMLKYESGKKSAELKTTEQRLSAFRSVQDVMAEYADYAITCETKNISLTNISNEELKEYQGKLRQELNHRIGKCERQKQEAERQIREVAEKEVYIEDFFKKGFDNLLSLINSVKDMRVQFDTILSSYDSILKKLQVDLENVEKERKNIEELFLEYVRDIDENMRYIDKNSTITIRGRSIKMLKLNVPDWEDNRELYKVRVREYVEYFIRRGIETVEENGNVEELLGKIITTKMIYDEVVGIANVGIRLYKIEAEREVPISWQEVSANSGGEGFLSAFVILTCLLSYMRRDESDLFATGEEGKVLIMDNPFAQTNAVHLLKPLMEMAKKTNTQLICLSGLGGDSIYNRFDNIYVLNIIHSNLRQGMQYLKGSHLKGKEIENMVLSRFKVEQMNLFDMDVDEPG